MIKSKELVLVLGFILSKMQMLFFAVGIAVVALLFYDFVSTIGLSESANNLLLSSTRVVSDQLNNDLVCSDKFSILPDALTKGYQQDRFFYDLDFSKKRLGEGEDAVNVLIFRIVEHKSNGTIGKVIAAKSVSTDGEFVLVDPGFIVEDTRVDTYYDKPSISLYPRASSSNAVVASSPDSFVALKEVVLGKTTTYIIPCSNQKEANNCVRNILRVGCFKLSQRAGVRDSDLIPSCFNKSTIVSDDIGSVQNYTWADCKSLFGYGG